MLESVIIIYDAQCSLCCGCMQWIKLHAIRKCLFEFIPCQSDERKVRFPEIGETGCLEFLHVVLPDRKILLGEKSLPEILCRLRYFRWISIFFRMPVFNLFPYALYRCIANSRFVISQTIVPLIQEKR
jgi:predicted DCC family thiol-disulfide oxidoreductase YuxK